MITQIVVVENLSDWKFEGLEGEVVHVDDYLTGQSYIKQKGIQVINLCRSHKYLSVGYYCSLLAEARGHRVLPSVKTMLDISRKSMYGLDAEYLDERVEKGFKKFVKNGDENTFEIDVFFGRCQSESLANIARHVFEAFPYPLLKVSFKLEKRWQIATIKPIEIHKLSIDAQAYFVETFSHFSQKRWSRPKERAATRYDIAILHDPKDPQPPSNAKALASFIKAGKAMGVEVELIEKKDYARLAEYDALFIRDTTRIDHYTYRFAKRAESEGMVVIDDPKSILLCTNKVYLAELLRANKIATPKTVIVGKNDLKAAEEELGFPMVLKVPDGSFSQGVFKAENEEQMREMTQKLFKTSELILAQEFLYTEFDWRIGVLNKKPIYASKYFMSKKHWQIVQYDGKGGFKEGSFKTLPIWEVPSQVIDVALKAANLIGNGLYGVDLKQNSQGVYVIEINDNPNIDAGIEDVIAKDGLYKSIMEEFVRRLDIQVGNLK